MYKIKSLEITNFKSYKSSHVIPFDSHFTCIIGPNGSGKSNILDAMVFVMTNKPYNIKNATVKLVLQDNNEIMTFTRYINNSGKNSYFVNNKKTVFKEFINNFIIYQSHTDIPISQIIEQVSGSINYKQEHDVLLSKYNDLMIKLKIEGEKRKQYLNILKENKKYEEEHTKNVKMVERKKDIENILFYYKINNLLDRYIFIQDADKILENKSLLAKKMLLSRSIKELRLQIDQKQNVIYKIDKDLSVKPNIIIPNFENLEKEYFRLLNNEECCKVEVDDDVKELLKEKEELVTKHQMMLDKFNTIQEKYLNLESELNKINNEILLSKNIKARTIKLYNMKSKIKSLPGVIGFVNDLIKCTNEKYEVAIKAILSAYESTVVVEDIDSAFKCIEYCKEHRLGRISCIVKCISKQTYVQKNLDKDLVSPLLVIDCPDNLRNVIENLFGNISITNKAYPVDYSVDVCTIDGVIVRSKGRIVKFNKINIHDSSLERRMEIIDTMNSIKKQIDSNSTVEIIQNKLKKLDEEIETRKIKKKEVLLPETKVFGDLFKINGYKNYNDYVTRNSKYYTEEQNAKHNLLKEKKDKILNYLELDTKKLDELQKEYDSIIINEFLEDNISEKEDIAEEIKDLFFIEKNEVVDVNFLVQKRQHKNDANLTDINNNELLTNFPFTSENISILRTELEEINKMLNNTCLIKNTTVLDFNLQKYDSLKKETLETKLNFNIIKNKRASLFTEYLTKLNEIISNLYSKISGGSCNIIAENSDEPFSGVKYYVMVPNKKYKEYDVLSGGEQMISRLVFMYALSKMSNKGFLLLDEVDSNLDNFNVNRLVDFIKSEDLQIVMVSLKVGVYKECNKMIGVYKRNGISNLLHYAF